MRPHSAQWIIKCRLKNPCSLNDFSINDISHYSNRTDNRKGGMSQSTHLIILIDYLQKVPRKAQKPIDSIMTCILLLCV